MTTQFDEVPRGWVVVPVSRVGSVKVGRQRSPTNRSGRYRTKYVRAANITARGLDLSSVFEMDFSPAERAIFGLEEGDILVAEASGSPAQVGRSALWRGEIPGCCYQNTVIRFRPHAAVPDYALIVLRHFWMTGLLAETAKGVGIQHLGTSRFARLPFPLPPMPEQRRIANEFAKRDTALRQSEDSLRSALDHCRKQESEVLAAAATGGLLANHPRALSTPEPPLRRSRPKALSLFDDPGPVNGLYDTPASWRWVRVDEAGEVALGKMLSPKSRTGSGLRPYLRVANVLEDRIDYSDLKSMHFGEEEYAHYVLQAGDILLNEGQSPELAGRPAVYGGEIAGLCFQNHLIRFRPSDAVLSEFALLVFRHYLRAGEFRKIAHWTTNIANLGLQRFAAMPFPLPPIAVQRAITKDVRRRLQALSVQQQSIEVSLARIPELAQELLAAAVSGALAVGDINDEPAASMLERLGLPAGRAVPSPAQPNQENEDLAVERRRDESTEGSAKSLVSALTEAGRPLTVPELFAAAGYDRDSTADIERFYLELRTVMGRQIRQSDSSRENALLEMIPQ